MSKECGKGILSWKQAENAVEQQTRDKYPNDNIKTQSSYKDGKKVKYGLPGSTRPDVIVEVLDPPPPIIAIEVKSYKNIDQAIKKANEQFDKRENELPKGAAQELHIDIRRVEGWNEDMEEKYKAELKAKGWANVKFLTEKDFK